MSQLIHELLTAELDLQTHRVTQMRGAHGRSTGDQVGNDFPAQQFAVEAIALGGGAKTHAGFGGQAQFHAHQTVTRVGFVAVDGGT